MEFVFAGLILSGVGLYYAGSAEWRNTWTWAHRILGLLLPVGLSVHWAAGRRWGETISK
jgi:cytochrome bd-type quinol oxidase subunit 2